MIQNKYALPLSVKAFWRGDDDSTEEIVTMPCDKDDSPDFYLLCDANNLTVAGDWADGTENAYYALADIRDRANALQGIPTEQLGEVKKAWLYALYRPHVESRYSESDGFDHYYLTIGGKEYLMFSPTVDGVVGALIAARKDGHDFKSRPDINALLDSVKEEM